jgi:hypothetical protein
MNLGGGMMKLLERFVFFEGNGDYVFGSSGRSVE